MPNKITDRERDLLRRFAKYYDNRHYFSGVGEYVDDFIAKEENK